MKILVTGGLGFLGSHLTETLLAQGHDLTVVDNRASNVVDESFLRQKGAKVYATGIEKFDSPHSFDQIYHCASLVGPAAVISYTTFLGYNIIETSYRVIEMAERMKARLLFVSTSEIYGAGGVFKEEDSKVINGKVSARLEYSVGKLLGEIMALDKARVSKLHVNILRPFNIVGPRQSPKGGFVLPRFVQSALEGKEITVFGDGTQVRAFTHVVEMVGAMIRIMESDFNGEVFNAGSPRNVIQIRELAKKVKAMTQSNSPIVYVDPKTIYGELYEQTNDRIPDASKIEKLLQWRASYSIEKIIQDTADYFLVQNKPNASPVGALTSPAESNQHQ